MAKSGLFTIPEALVPFVIPDAESSMFDFGDLAKMFAAFDDAETAAWRQMLDTKFSQIEAYDRYVSGSSPFGTHQGVKGWSSPALWS